MDDNSTYAVSCFCKSCILIESKKFEQKKSSKEAFQILYDAFRYYSQIAKEFEEEMEKLKARQSSEIQAQFVSVFRSPNSKNGLTHCIKCSHQHVNLVCKGFSSHNLESSKRESEFTCPVAVFGNESDPTQRPMYPKHLVYENGQDIQLEEIRATLYWKKIEKEEQISNQMMQKNNKLDENTLFTRTPSRKTKTLNVETTACSPHSRDIRKSLQYSSCENLANSSLKIKTMDKQPHNTTNNEDESRPWSKEFCESISTSDHLSKTTNEFPSFANPNYEKLEVTRPILNVASVISSSETKADLMNEKQSLKECRIPYTSTNNITSVYSPATNAEENEASVSNHCRGKPKLPSVNILVPVNTPLKTAQIEPSLSTNAKAEPKFCDTTFICNAAREKATSLRETSVIQEEKKSKDSEPLKQNVGLWDETVRKFSRQNDVSEIESSSKNRQLNKVSSTNNENKENLLPINRNTSFWDEDEEDITCNTKAFTKMLPSSTPNRRKSQFFSSAPFNELKSSSDHSRQSMANATMLNLSMIPETSRERSSRSSGSGNLTIVNSKNVPEKPSLSAIVEFEEKSSKCDNISDPFDPELLDSLLEKMQFPCPHHRDGYHAFDTNISVKKTMSNVQLGSVKYTIVGEIGKGNYARIVKARVSSKPTDLVALKLQKPACEWEYYISKEIRKRLESQEKRQYFIDYSDIFVFQNGSVLLSEWAPLGSLLSFRNALKTSSNGPEKYPMVITVHLGIQIISAVEYLHSCKIIHGDIKPDNFIISSVSNDGQPFIKLIDYGRSVDMTLFPENVEFQKVVTTEDFTCHEMRDGKPWTYQTDLFGVAGTLYVLLNGEYMKTVKRDGVWQLKKPLARYMHREQWDPVFKTLLNVPSCSELPDLSMLKEKLKIFYGSFTQLEKKHQFSKILPVFKR